MNIPLREVTSSQIKAIGHDPEINTLAILFHSGGLYHYQNFTAGDFEAFAAAPSIGSHFYKYIKRPEKYPYKKQ